LSFVYVVSCVVRSLCDELIIRAEESYWVSVCDLESPEIRRRAAPPRGEKSYTCPPFIGIFVSDDN
jgi:hypothetical protein